LQVISEDDYAALAAFFLVSMNPLNSDHEQKYTAFNLRGILLFGDKFFTECKIMDKKKFYPWGFLHPH